MAQWLRPVLPSLRALVLSLPMTNVVGGESRFLYSHGIYTHIYTHTTTMKLSESDGHSSIPCVFVPITFSVSCIRNFLFETG